MISINFIMKLLELVGFGAVNELHVQNNLIYLIPHYYQYKRDSQNFYTMCRSYMIFPHILYLIIDYGLLSFS